MHDVIYVVIVGHTVIIYLRDGNKRRMKLTVDLFYFMSLFAGQAVCLAADIIPYICVVTFYVSGQTIDYLQ